VSRVTLDSEQQHKYARFANLSTSNSNVITIVMPTKGEDAVDARSELPATRRMFGAHNSLTIDNNMSIDYNQSLLMEKKEEIQAIVKKRQRKAAYLAALKEAE